MGEDKKGFLAKEKVVDYQIVCCLLNFLKGLFVQAVYSVNDRRRPNAQIRACRKTNFLKKNNLVSSQDFLWVELPPAKNRESHLLIGVKASLRTVLNRFRLLAGRFLVQRISLKQGWGKKKESTTSGCKVMAFLIPIIITVWMTGTENQSVGSIRFSSLCTVHMRPCRI